MLNLSDNELDKLSREAAENFEPAGGTEAWSRLEQMLDKHLGKPTPIPKTIRPGTVFLYSGAMLILVGATYFFIKSKQNNQNSTLPVSTTITDKKNSASGAATDKALSVPKNAALHPAVPGTSAAASSRQSTNPQTKTAPVTSGPIARKPLAPAQGIDQATEGSQELAAATHKNNDYNKNAAGVRSIRLTHHDSAGGFAHGSNKAASAAVGANQDTRTNDLAQTKGRPDVANFSAPGDEAGNRRSVGIRRADKNQDASDRERAGHMLNQNAAGNSSRDRMKQQPGATSAENQEPLATYAQVPFIQSQFAGASLVSDSALKAFNKSTAITGIIPRGRPHRSAYVNRSLQIGLLAAPEFSRVKYIYNNNRIGNNFGITLSYALSGPLSVNTGILFSEKYYQADEQQFHAPPNVVGRDADIEFVNASSHVIDIPLNLRYNYFSDGNSSFFINGGLSSYFITRQDFSYYCHFYNTSVNYSRWVAPQTQPSRKANPFSIVNFSAGFETSFTKSLSFQFEPYMKMPIRGIGFGKVDLSSYGVFLSLKYAPVLGRGRR